MNYEGVMARPVRSGRWGESTAPDVRFRPDSRRRPCVSAKEFARRCGVSVTAVIKAIRAGRIPAARRDHLGAAAKGFAVRNYTLHKQMGER